MNILTILSQDVQMAPTRVEFTSRRVGVNVGGLTFPYWFSLAFWVVFCFCLFVVTDRNA